MEQMYGAVNLQKAKRVPIFKASLKEKLTKYVTANSTFLVQLPSCYAAEGTLDTNVATGPYHIPPSPPFNLTSSMSVANDIRVICSNSMTLVDESFQLLRDKASEILAFIATDLDRKFSTTIPPHMPVAYAMKGRSLSITTMRKLMQMT